VAIVSELIWYSTRHIFACSVNKLLETAMLSHRFSRARFFARVRVSERTHARLSRKCFLLASAREYSAYLPGLSEYPGQPRRFTGVLTFRAGKKPRLISSFCCTARRDSLKMSYRSVRNTGIIV